MKQQRRDYWCGIAAVANALECLGVKRTQGQINKLLHCSEERGTPEEEIIRGLLACGAAVDEWKFPAWSSSHDWLDQHLIKRGPVILCVDQYDHWVTCIGICGLRYSVFDPSLGAGYRSYDREGMKTRWKLGVANGGPTYYGIGVA